MHKLHQSTKTSYFENCHLLSIFITTNAGEIPTTKAALTAAHSRKTTTFCKCWRHREECSGTAQTANRLSGRFAVPVPSSLCSERLFVVQPAEGHALRLWHGTAARLRHPDRGELQETKARYRNADPTPAKSNRHITANLTPGHRGHQLSQFKFLKEQNHSFSD